MQAPMEDALTKMKLLEQGALANPDEQRMVGHYWLRDPDLAPDPGTGKAIRETVKKVTVFAESVHEGSLKPPESERFTILLFIGIGGSALGPQFMYHALGNARSPGLRSYFLDNTDPDGMERTFALIGGSWPETLTLVVSKSGGTKETRNGMLEVAQAYRRSGLEFAKHAAAVTGEGSALDHLAQEEGWLARFPMWDWVGGRTSVMSAAGLLPAALQGISIPEFLAGARSMDRATRKREVAQNPAVLLALMWHHAGNGKGDRAMVVIPYKDRLELFNRYLQQLVMESLGKERNLNGQIVEQGLSVFGNKGSTDQHAFMQQLRDGRPDFFVNFIEVLRDRSGQTLEVEPGVTSGDYLHGFLLGTREALSEKERQSITLTLNEICPKSMGALIALYERAVGLYAFLIGINAYHQPGVEAGKKAAADVLTLQRCILTHLADHPEKTFNVESLTRGIGCMGMEEQVFKLLGHLSANGRVMQTKSNSPFDCLYSTASVHK